MNQEEAHHIPRAPYGLPQEEQAQWWTSSDLLRTDDK